MKSGERSGQNIKHTSWSAQAVVRKDHRWWLNRNVFSHRSMETGGSRSRCQQVVSPKASLLGPQTATSSLGSWEYPLCEHLWGLFSWHQSCWIKAPHLMTSHNLMTSVKVLFQDTATVELGLQEVDFRGHNSVYNTYMILWPCMWVEVLTFILQSSV